MPVEANIPVLFYVKLASYVLLAGAVALEVLT